MYFFFSKLELENHTIYLKSRIYYRLNGSLFWLIKRRELQCWYSRKIGNLNSKVRFSRNCSRDPKALSVCVLSGDDAAEHVGRAPSSPTVTIGVLGLPSRIFMNL